MTNHSMQKYPPRRTGLVRYTPQKEIEKNKTDVIIFETEVEAEIIRLYGPNYLLLQKSYREAWLQAIDSVVMKKPKSPTRTFTVAVFP